MQVNTWNVSRQGSMPAQLTGDIEAIPEICVTRSFNAAS